MTPDLVALKNEVAALSRKLSDLENRHSTHRHLGSDLSQKLTSAAGGGAAGGSTTQVQFNKLGVLAGNANFTFDDTPGGTFVLTTFDGIAGNGGDIFITAGNGVTTFTGGDVSIQAGASGTGNPGASIDFGPGDIVDGGLLNLFGGNGVDTNSNAGGINLNPGTPNGSGTRGYVKFFEYSTSSYVSLDSSLITADRLQKFPDQDGTFAMLGGSDTQVQYNDAGVQAGDAGMVYDKTSGALTLTHVGGLNTYITISPAFQKIAFEKHGGGVSVDTITGTAGGALVLLAGATDTTHVGGAVSLQGGYGRSPAQAGDVIVNLGNSAFTTTSTEGYLWIPAANGAMTATPSISSGISVIAGMVYDYVNDKLYIYNNNTHTWKKVQLV